jgi:hypothetical protein
MGGLGSFLDEEVRGVELCGSRKEGSRVGGRKGFVSYMGKRRTPFPIVVLTITFVTWEGWRTIVTIGGFYYCEERDCDEHPHERQNAT